jgi:pyridoxal phosphate-dependent aminotransferase EpsN
MPRIYLSPPDLCGSELALLGDALASGWIAPLGPHVDALEREVAAVVDMPHAVALSSGTAALHLALAVLGVGPGDEVLCSTLTFAATANAIRYLGAEPVFIDSERASWNLDPQLLAAELERCAGRGKLPRAVIAVDLYGQCANLGEISELCRRFKVPLVEDAAEALGATHRGRPAGSWGDLSILSFNGNKIITTSGGGMLLGRRQDLIDRARHLATQARDPAPHYEHSTIGYNYRLSNLLAAVGRAQLADLPRRVSARRAHNVSYRDQLGQLPGWSFMPEEPSGTSTFWLSCATVEPRGAVGRDSLIAALAQEDIEARPVWKPMHLQPVFREFRAVGGAVAAELFEKGLCLPSGSNLSADDRARVITILRRHAGAATG